MKETHKQFISYAGVGLLALAADWTVFFILVHMQVFFLWAQAVARLVGGLTNFILNKKISFRQQQSHARTEIRRFLLLYVVSYHLALLLLYAYHDVMKIPLLIAKPMSDGTCFIFNFFVMKFYVYSGLAGIRHHSARFIKEKMFRRS